MEWYEDLFEKKRMFSIRAYLGTCTLSCSKLIVI